MISEIAAEKASSEAYAKSYSQAFTNAVQSVSQAALHAETARNSAEQADKLLKATLNSAELAAQVASSASVGKSVVEIADIVSERFKADGLIEASITKAFPKGTIVLNLLQPKCPPGFSSAGFVGIELQDKGPLLRLLEADKEVYDRRNIRDGDSALAGTDGVKAYSCYKG